MAYIAQLEEGYLPYFWGFVSELAEEHPHNIFADAAPLGFALPIGLEVQNLNQR